MNLLTILLQTVAEQAQSGGAGGQSPFTMIIFLVVLFGVMYFFMIRPQQKRQKELNQFRNQLEKGQKVITAGGIYGTIKELKERYVILEVDSNTSLRVDRSMIMRSTEDVQQ